ncbi:MAG: CoA-binding protein [Bacteroidetes bacterium]|nr:CoA-binding protein [Bacteroidota bacterium]MBV6461654.1 hypothetical protein [Flavobacteriales bacterium]WKZ74132.1 MAG: CoA-binding protein [Vicingaceae bacterium]MCL4816805.1 CoA-binding protein [Flavobacteriales bacterium]NOG95743.1 CoA-binding protein [Bacteroidota bacterium]
MSKDTLVIGASLKPDKYSHKAVLQLLAHGHFVKAIGIKAGNISTVTVQTDTPLFSDINTITLYVNPTNQKPYYKYIIETNPQRVIFNPGTENAELQQLLNENNIKWEEACTLVLLSLNKF